MGGCMGGGAVDTLHYNIDKENKIIYFPYKEITIDYQNQTVSEKGEVISFQTLEQKIKTKLPKFWEFIFDKAINNLRIALR